MKKKFLLPILSVCMVVALVSVGFAAWLITGNDTTGATGNFVTHDVTNEYFTASASTTDGKIEFGKGSATTTNATPWFNFDGDSQEKLTATFTVKVTPDVAENLSTILTKYNIMVMLKAQNDEYDAAVLTGIVAYPEIACGETKATATNLSTGVSIKLTETDFNESGEATVTVTFNWGTNGNPYTYYNNTHTTAQEAGQQIRKAATDALKTLHKLNNDLYDITLSVAPVTSGS